MPRYGAPHQTACDLQGVLRDNVLDPLTDKKLIASMALAWERLEERKRILRNKPLPKSVDFTKLATRVQPQPSFTEPEPPHNPGQTPASPKAES
jgi:hypothetical protein